MGNKTRAKTEDRAPAPTGKPIDVNDATFDRIVGESELPVLVDFWANWCGPCKAMAPGLEALAASHADRLLVVKYDTERNRRVMEAMNVRSLPTLVLFRDGQVLDVQIGAVAPARLAAWVDKAISPKKGLLERLFG